MGMNLSPTARIIVPTAAMSILLLLLGGIAAWYLHQLQQDSSELLSGTVAKVEAAEELELISHEVRYQLRQYDAADEQRIRTVLAKLHEDANAWLANAEQLADTDRGKELIRNMQRGYAHLFGEFAKIADQGQSDQRRQEIFQAIHDMTAATELRLD